MNRAVCVRERAESMDVLAPIPTRLPSRQAEIRHDAAVRRDERGRIGRELHDSTSQLLVALQLNLACLRQSSKPADSRRLFLTLDQILQELHCEVRSISSLGESSLLEEDLPAALRTMATHFELLTKIKVTLGLPSGYVCRGDGAEMSLFRIAQEAFANVARHAEATEVMLRLNSHKNGALTLSIEDNGVGFGKSGEVELPQAGTGMENIRRRVRDMGGRLALTHLRRGSRLAVTIPAPPSPAGAAAASVSNFAKAALV